MTAQIAARFRPDLVFVTTANTPLHHRSNLDNSFISCCKRAGIQTKTVNAEGRLVEHVDVHSLRRTFATNLIASYTFPLMVSLLPFPPLPRLCAGEGLGVRGRLCGSGPAPQPHTPQP